MHARARAHTHTLIRY